LNREIIKHVVEKILRTDKNKMLFLTNFS